MTIENDTVNELEIKKSRFITLLIKLNDENMVSNHLEKIKKKYKFANHYCYAYIINNKEKANDDKEPSGTAGIPILNVLKKNNLNNVLCVVIRYFGGIKLGVSGLVRAYSNSVSIALKNINIIPDITLYKIKIVFSYDNINTINNILNNYTISTKLFDTYITYEFIINETDLNFINDNLNKLILKIDINQL